MSFELSPPNFPYSTRYPPPDPSNPLVSLENLRLSHRFSYFGDRRDGQEWDPYRAYEEEKARVDSLPSLFSTVEKSKLRPRSRTISYFQSSLPYDATKRLRIRSTPSTPDFSKSSISALTSSQHLPPVHIQSKFGLSLSATRNFALSLSEFGSAPNFHSFPSDIESFFQDDLGSPSKVSEDGHRLSNGSYHERSSVAGLETVESNDTSVYVRQGTPLATCELFYRPDSQPEPAVQPTPFPRFPRDSAVHLSHSSISNRDYCNSVHSSRISSSSLCNNGPHTMIRPPANSPVNSLERPATSDWVPPSSWSLAIGRDSASDDLILPSPPPSVLRNPRPLSPLQFSLESRSRKDATPLTSPVVPSPEGFRLPYNLEDSVIREKPKVRRFHRNALPTLSELQRASRLEVTAADGTQVPFGSLFNAQRTVVVFIRHFWCPSCQEYMYSVHNAVTPELLSQRGLNLVVIGNGSHSMIKSYCKIFKSPYKLYTDPSLQVYKALGMTLCTAKGGPPSECGAYIKRGFLGGLAMVVRNVLTGRFPIWENSGDLRQLGGEFVLGPGPTCSFAHRMHTTRSHAPILNVLNAAGLEMREKISMHRRLGSSDSAVDEDIWMAKRMANLANINRKKEARRSGLPVQFNGIGE